MAQGKRHKDSSELADEAVSLGAATAVPPGEAITNNAGAAVRRAARAANYRSVAPLLWPNPDHAPKLLERRTEATSVLGAVLAGEASNVAEIAAVTGLARHVVVATLRRDDVRRAVKDCADAELVATVLPLVRVLAKLAGKDENSADRKLLAGLVGLLGADGSASAPPAGLAESLAAALRDAAARAAGARAALLIEQDAPRGIADLL